MEFENASGPKYSTREEWLAAAVKELRPMFKDAGADLPKHLRVSCGFPLGSRKAVGQCFIARASKEKLHNIFISPTLDDPTHKAGVLPTLVHEMVHACLPEEAGHKAPFSKLAGDLGLLPKWTATTASPDLIEKLERIARKLGKYPHGALNPTELPKKQSTRLIKVQCTDDECGGVVRATMKWIEKALEENGTCSCMVCGGAAEPEVSEDEED